MVALSVLAACSAATDSPPTTEPAASGSGAGRGNAEADSAVAAIKPEVAHREEKFGVPTFTWLRQPADVAFHAGDAKAEDIAWGTIRSLSRDYGLGRDALASASITHVHDTGSGGIIARFTQKVDGLDVFRVTMNVAMTRDLQPVAATGFLAPLVKVRPNRHFKLDAPSSVASALKAMTGADVGAAALRRTGEEPGGYDQYTFEPIVAGAGRLLATSPVRVKKVWFPHPKGLEAAFYVELSVGAANATDSAQMSFVVSATDGSVLFKKNLVAADAFSYRVWADATGGKFPLDGPHGTIGTPHPTGTPNKFQAPFIPANLVTLQNAPFSKNDPWLPANATTTNGNNVDAYADLIAPDGYNEHPVPPDGGAGDAGAPDAGDSGTGDAGAPDAATSDAGAGEAGPGEAPGDVRPPLTGDKTFDHVYDHDKNPEASASQKHAATTQLFYTLNFLHDWFYDVGFDEASGNHQKDNLGRGGLGNDALLGEAQDFSGRNNANASTPADGRPSRIQMFLFDGNGIVKGAVTAPPAIAGDMGEVAAASFGQKIYNFSGNVVLVDDGVVGAAGTNPPSPAGTLTDGCEAPFANAAALVGKIALVDRGRCNFSIKVKNAQTAGAIGVLVANNSATGLPGMGGEDDTVTIPSLGISQAKGNELKANLASTVTVSLRRDRVIDRDGSLDTLVVTHEWGHTISNRLIGNANGLDNNQGNSMGEGWGDFTAMLVQVREEDARVAANKNWSGTYGDAVYDMSGGENDGFYYGFRRFPYSVDMAKNPLTLTHIQNGVALPTTAPINPSGGGATNAEVHNAGEVWATMLWECYVSLLRDTARLSFTQAQERMKAYYVASLKLTPSSPTYLEARDAVLAAAYANDPKDFELFSNAFARRGAGAGAVAPPRESVDHVGVTESFVAGNDLQIIGTKLDDSVKSCDQDGTLDNAETGKLTITVKNVGLRPLHATTGVVTSPNGALKFANGGHVTFPPSQPFQTVEAKIDVELVGGASIMPATINLQIADQAVPRTIFGKRDDVFQFDVVAANSKTDSVDTAITPWTLGGDTTQPVTAPWTREAIGPDGFWHIRGNGGRSDQYLVSPPLTVAAAGDFTFSYRNRYVFEGDGETHYDGGVLEISQDNGATWTDIGASASPGYGGKLTGESGNPLGGRDAWVEASEGYPAYTTTTVSLGAAYQGKSVLVRFRVATDEATGSSGWDVDNVTFNNITNTPFASRVADRAQCSNKPPVAIAGAAREVPERSEVALAGSGTDPDGNTLTYAWTQTAGPSVTLTNPTSATPTFTAPEVKASTTLTFSLVVNDGTAASPPSAVDITVTNANRPPVANAGATQTVALGAPVTLAGSGSTDPDGDTLVYAWGQASGMPVELTGGNTAAPTFKAPSTPTTLWFTLVVSDGTTNSLPSSVGVVVGSGVAPTGSTVPGGSTGGPINAGGGDEGCSVTPGSSQKSGTTGGWMAALAALAFAGFRRRSRTS